MAKGAVAKEEIFKKILDTFDGSFMWNNGKECRIPWDEGNGIVQIKVALTCAKDIVSAEGESAAVRKEEDDFSNFPAPRTEKKMPAEPTPEEKQNIEDLLSALGLQ